MTPIIAIELVIEIHDTIIHLTGGASGVDAGKLAGALARVEQQVFYNGLDDVFEIACWYAIAIAKSHGFIDGNKRTALATMLTFLDIQGVTLHHDTGLDDMMVDVVESQLSHEVLAKYLAIYIQQFIID